MIAREKTEALGGAARRLAREARRVLYGRKAQRARMLLLGRNLNDGWLAVLILWLLLSVIAYLYLQPLIYMVARMFMSLTDMIDPTVKYIPRAPTLENLSDAWRGLRYPRAFANTVLIAAVCSALQVAVCALTGFALGRLPFPGKKLITFLVMVTFLIPPQVIIIPLYVMYSRLGLLNTPLVFMVPALFGQGLRSALFILIFRHFFKSQPKVLEEAARMDGASTFRLFWRIMLPLSRTACLIVFLFSFIWYWNMSYEPSMFLSGDYMPLSLRLDGLEAALLAEEGRMFDYRVLTQIHEGQKMAGAFLVILPPLILFLFAPRWFVESIDRTGIIE